MYEENDLHTGQIYTYAECLEVLHLCPTFRATYLNYDIEKNIL